MIIEVNEQELKQVGESLALIAEKLKTPTYYNCTFPQQAPLIIPKEMFTGIAKQQQNPTDEQAQAEEHEIISFIQDKTGFDEGQIKWILQLADEFYNNNTREF